jgi:hypothetical protein
MEFFGFHRPRSKGFDSDVSVKDTVSIFEVGERGSGVCQVTGRKKIVARQHSLPKRQKTQHYLV